MIIYCLVILFISSLLSSQCNFLAAFLQLLPLAVSFADPLPAPILSTDPRHDVYYEGESVTLKCLAPTLRKIRGFRFFNQTGEQINQTASFSDLTALFKLTATKASSGEYTCMYFLKESGREIPSNRSLPLSLKVQAAPMAPTLSLDPQQQVYRPGNHVNLLCSFPSSPDDVKQVQYYADFGLAVSVPVSNVKNYSFNLRITGEADSGSYSCAYFVNKAARPVRSELSRSVIVYVKSHKISWIREIIVGGLFFTINGLIFFFSHCLMKRREVGEGMEGREQDEKKEGGKRAPKAEQVLWSHLHCAPRTRIFSPGIFARTCARLLRRLTPQSLSVWQLLKPRGVTSLQHNSTENLQRRRSQQNRSTERN
ncbi:immunoglobulin superfamily member 1-like isoform X3 [Aquila chrysaetos chrysaetos]|uniref:immunoglobulin superfamily member 1-like isoform X3 n=1 Tax=Aquila chrysaetos chrysaetos TaxID=223781 RepID=UPI001176D188|nr:immunoglobulin superfamily member 1-like isoform X3 [Aquila chrysaetos chrysaetos]